MYRNIAGAEQATVAESGRAKPHHLPDEQLWWILLCGLLPGVPKKSDFMGIYYLSRYTAPIVFVLFGAHIVADPIQFATICL